MAFNLESFKTISVIYPNWAGGKCIINALGISRHACLQHKSLAELQLIGQINSQDKFEFLINKLTASKYHWDDLGLGCVQFYGDRPELAINEFKNYGQGSADEFKRNDILLEEIHKQNISIFKPIHCARTWKKFLTIANPFIIQMINVGPIIEYRTINKWAPAYISKQELGLQQVLEQTRQVPDFVWDSSCIFDNTKFVDNIRQLYTMLNFDDFNADWISQLQEAYLDIWKFNRSYTLHFPGFLSQHL